MFNSNNFTFTIQKGVLFNPHLLKPFNSKFENSRPKYGSIIIISKDDTETLDKIQSAIDCVIQKIGVSDTDDIKSPLKDGDKDYPLEKLYENSIYLYASSLFQPCVVDHKVQKIMFRTEEYKTGSYANVELAIVQHNISGKYIISFELRNVQILKKNKLLELRAKPEDVFVVEEDDEE